MRNEDKIDILINEVQSDYNSISGYILRMWNVINTSFYIDIFYYFWTNLKWLLI